MSGYYPMLIKLAGRSCVVVGGGKVAERKARTLIEAGAVVKVVSPELTSRLAEWERAGKLTAIRREYAIGDLTGAYLAVAAAGPPEVNRAVCREAEEVGCPVNCADDPERGSFIVPAAFNRGRLQIAVSTSGASPSMARRIKAELEERYGQEYAEALEFLQEVRRLVLKRVEDGPRRKELLLQAAQWDLPAIIRSGTFAEFRRGVLARLNCHPGTLSGTMDGEHNES